MPSIKKNFAYNSILTVTNYIFPLITFPYVSRVLGVNNVGICSFATSVVQYCILFAMMGTMTVGIREISRAGSNKQLRSKVFSSLLTLNLLTTLISICVLLFSIEAIPKLKEHSELFYIGSAHILANSLLIEWLFKGLENFRYITIRAIVVKSIYVLAILCIVKNEDDYVKYFLLTVLTTIINASINLFYSRHFVNFSIRDINIVPYIRSYITFGSYQLLTSLYISFNVLYLGFVSNPVQVGYYTTANKLYSIIIGLFSAFTAVMMPRMSSLIAEGKIQEFKLLTEKSVDVLFAFSLPLIIITEACAPQIISILAGKGYEGAIIPMRIVMPLMLIIGYEQILIIQMLTPLKKDKAVLTNSAIGALTGVMFNILFVARLGCVGSAIVWISSEIAVLISAQYFVNKYVGFHLPYKSFLRRALYVTPLLVCSLFLSRLINNVYLSLLLISLIVLSSTFFLELKIICNDIVVSNFKHFLNRCGKLFH